MGQTLDMLLNIDPEKVKDRPVKQLLMPRLSKLADGEVYFAIQALTLDETKDIREKATKIRFNKAHEREEYYDEEEASIFVILQSVTDPNLKDKQLLEKFGAPTPKELIKTLLLSGEIASLSEQIMKLSGFNSTTELDGDDLKNS